MRLLVAGHLSKFRPFWERKIGILEDIRPLVFRRMTPDLGQERFAEILQLLFADARNAAELR